MTEPFAPYKTSLTGYLRMFWQLSLSLYKNFFREPGVLFWVFGFPLMIAWVLGLAFSTDRAETRVIGLLGQGQVHQFLLQQGASRNAQGELELRLTQGEGQLILRFVPLNAAEAQKFQVLGRGLLVQDGAKPLYQYDPQQAEAASAAWVLRARLAEGAQEPQIQAVKTQGSRYIDFLIPGLLAMGVMNSCIWGVGWGLIEMRMKQLLRRMVATPLPRWMLLLVQIANRFLLSIMEAVILIVFSGLFFNFTFTGSWLGFLVLMVSGNFAFAGIAVLMGSRTASTTVGNGLINLITLPMMILSGIFFSAENFPPWAQQGIHWLPLTQLANGLRALSNQGAGLAEVISASLYLAAVGLVFFLLGLRLFRWH